VSEYLKKLKEAIKATHDCHATHVASEPIKEVFRGKVAWEGKVEVFLVEHPRAEKCYAWGHHDEKGGWEITTVLEIPPVISAETAVRASIVAHHKA
jgi:hypothetical protein